MVADQTLYLYLRIFPRSELFQVTVLENGLSGDRKARECYTGRVQQRPINHNTSEAPILWLLSCSQGDQS